MGKDRKKSPKDQEGKRTHKKERAKKLNESGMGKEEVKETLKRERRRAEKALARRTKHVCFNCRQPGHDLAECPQASSGPKKPTAASSGKICFKCGSNEHTSRDCESRLKGADAFAFATCLYARRRDTWPRRARTTPR